MACAEVRGLVEDVPFDPTLTRYVLDVLDFRAICNLSSGLPTGRRLLSGKYKGAAVNRRYSDVFPYDDFRAELQEVKLLVGDEPFVVSFRSNRKHQVDYTSVKWAGSNCCNQTRTDNA